MLKKIRAVVMKNLECEDFAGRRPDAPRGAHHQESDARSQSAEDSAHFCTAYSAGRVVVVIELDDAVRRFAKADEPRWRRAWVRAQPNGMGLTWPD